MIVVPPAENTFRPPFRRRPLPTLMLDFVGIMGLMVAAFGLLIQQMKGAEVERQEHS